MSNRTKTLAVTAGSRLATRAVPVTPAIHMAAVSHFADAAELDAALDGQDFVYTRIRGENAELLEQAVAALEGAEACAAYSTGMAALKAVYEAQALKPGDRVVAPMDGYGVTRALLAGLCEADGVELHALRLSDADAPDRIRALQPKLVVAESETNPLLSVPDLRGLSDATHAASGVLAVDATFVSPILQRPLGHGADYSVHSTTKWINGHSDAMGGVVSGDASRIEPLRKARVLSGAIVGPFEAWLTLRGLRTLPIRMAAHCEHARCVAQALERASHVVSKVIYPGFKTHPDHDVAKRMFVNGFGGMVSFELRGADRAASFRLLEGLRLLRAAPSLGDVATLVMHPATASARRLSDEQRATAGIGEGLIRVSVGLEDPEDVAGELIAAAERALDTKGAGSR